MAKRSRPSGKKAQEINKADYSKEAEECFKISIQEPLKQAEKIGKVDIVVGIPFYNEADTVGEVIKTVYKGLEEYYPDQKCAIVASGSSVGGKALDVINELSKTSKINRIAFLLNDEKLNGKGWSIRAIFEIARVLNADLAIIEADISSRQKNGDIEGVAPDWIKLLLEPVKKQEIDLVMSRFNRHYFESFVSTRLVYPVLAAIFNCPIHDPEGGQWGISNRLLRTCLQ
ncbi:hypothetical protein ACFLTB_05495, partial [Chloroflexota bacterium]